MKTTSLSKVAALASTLLVSAVVAVEEPMDPRCLLRPPPPEAINCTLAMPEGVPKRPDTAYWWGPELHVDRETEWWDIDYLGWYPRHHMYGDCGPQNGGKKCRRPGLCCSKAGKCGRGPVNCGKHCLVGYGLCPQDMWTGEKYGGKCAGPEGKSCPEGFCCSKEGYCCKSDKCCTVPDNCQRAFGKCDSDAAPKGVDPSTDARLHDSRVPYGQTIRSCTRERTLALTFDDGPIHIDTDNILNLLTDHGARATFFLNGVAFGANQLDMDSIRVNDTIRMVLNGHQVASKTWSSMYLDTTKSDDRRTEMYKMERAIANIVGHWPTYMRPPHRLCSAESGCLRDMNDLGYHVIDYDFEAPEGDMSEEERKKIIDEEFERRGPNGNMLVMQHDNAQSTIWTTKYLLQKARELGWEAVTVGECMNDAPQDWLQRPTWTQLDQMADYACVVTSHGFCGKIQPFHNKTECQDTVLQCTKDVQMCPRGTEGCDKFKAICSQVAKACELPVPGR